ncbi:hypothetical protein HZC34_02860 [Candidatus Saganbacteria bacterium]|nr:hypothetical protein [Candidatus Saganbacteria bacterium]
MKKMFGNWSLGLGIYLAIGILIFGFTALAVGCGQTTTSATTTTTSTTTTSTSSTSSTTTTTTTTTTVTISSTQVSAARAASILANGGSSAGTSTGTVGNASGTSVAVSSLSILSINSIMALAAGGPPDSFFTPLPADGYISPTTESLGGNMTPYIKLITVGGTTIDAAFLSGKKIAIIGTVDAKSILSGSPGSMPAGFNAGLMSFMDNFEGTASTQEAYASASIFHAITTEAEYLCWAFIFPSMESSIISAGGGAATSMNGKHLITPEVTASNKIGSMAVKMVFSKTATGEIVVNVNTAPTGRPTSGTYSGSGKLTTAVATLDAVMSMVFGSSGPPTSVTIIATTESSPAITVSVSMNPSTGGLPSGSLFNSAGTLIGTLEATSSGGRVYIGNTSEAFSF